ncbi:bifunctional UDP-sugar hydrolase/5'-nucleotidase UshA [uncultured Ferrimonas sp.]|uniref:bifunctional UDP-sugar hydrolase/5'-nucleotidase UshA n=1 Tax=uncultured Ferrimonas sp. TaxID=432640 RepID=UPI0026364D40|nr:bifunctional UDP-sugar hydrolase/5'-nucleotidase UshA [uncultured Ferrimonas sp.]
MQRTNLIPLIGLSIAVTFIGGCHDDDDDAPVIEQPVKFTLLHTNDHHGRFWRNRDSEYGMAARKTLIDQIRAEVEQAGGEVILLSGGDINTGVPESDLLDAEPDFVGMNLLGYHAMAIGNHEFDNPRSVLQAQQALAEFPFLSANIYDDRFGVRLFDSHALFTINGLKIAVVGFTTEDTPIKSNPDYVAGLEFRDPKTEAATLLPQLIETESPDLVFAVTHMGHYANGNSGNNAPGDVALAESLDAGLLDVIVGGHSQNPVCVEADGSYSDFTPGDDCMPDMKNGTYIMQAHEWGRYVGRADFEYLNGNLTMTSYGLVPVNLLDGDDQLIGAAIAEDPDVLAALQPYQDAGGEELNVVIASSNGKLEGDRAVVRSMQTNLGRLIATAQSSVIQGAAFGIVNSGGVRASIAAGDIAYRDVLTVQPFGNTVAEARMSGSQLLTYLGQVASQANFGENGGYPQFAGINMTIDCANQSVSISELGGAAFDVNANYVFSIPSFSASGGDGYPAIDGVIDSGFVDAQVLADYLENALGGSVDVASFAPAGELTFINSNNSEGCEVATAP